MPFDVQCLQGLEKRGCPGGCGKGEGRSSHPGPQPEDAEIHLERNAVEMIEKSMENRCVVCSAIIPEGQQVCPNCKAGDIPKVTNNADGREKMKIIKYFDPRKKKKARFKKSLSRHLKRGGLIYSGFVTFTDELFTEEEWNERKAGSEGSSETD